MLPVRGPSRSGMLTFTTFPPGAIGHRDFSSMIEKTPRARGMSEKELRARIDRVIAEEERTYGRLIELRDLFRAISGELDSSTASLPNISNIVATLSRFRRSKP
jgi:hypothetical protein